MNDNHDKGNNIFSTLLLPISIPLSLIFYIMVLVLYGPSMSSSRMPERSEQADKDLKNATRIISWLVISTFSWVIYLEVFQLLTTNYQETIFETQFRIKNPTSFQYIAMMGAGGYLSFLATLPILFVHNLKDDRYKKKHVRQVLIVGSWLGLFSTILWFLITNKSVTDKIKASFHSYLSPSSTQ